jgi:fatty-acyl-CoA synthase
MRRTAAPRSQWSAADVHPGVHAAEKPDHPAVIMATSGETVTYRELDERADRLARLWWDRGLRRGDHVAILMQNHPRWFDAVWAALRSGLYYTPVNWHLTAPEVAYIVEDCGARSVVASSAMAAQAAELDVEVPLAVGGGIDGWEDYEEAIAAHPATPLAERPEGAGMFYSSGTTGRPKGILFPLPNRSIDDENPLARYRSPMTCGPDSVYLSPAPMYHTSPVVFCSLAHRAGATTVVMERWDPEAALAAIERYRCDRAQFVPTMFVRMLKLPQEVRDR